MFQSSNRRHNSTSTVQKKLHESDLHGEIPAKAHAEEDHKKKTAWAKRNKEWTLGWAWLTDMVHSAKRLNSQVPVSVWYATKKYCIAVMAKKC